MESDEEKEKEVQKEKDKDIGTLEKKLAKLEGKVNQMCEWMQS